MIAIISDIHGNYPALEAVLSYLDSINCKQIYSLGDVAGYYCMINECIDELKKRSITNILGNHDNYIITNTRCPRSNSANDCLDYQRKIITKENFEWLKKSVSNISFSNVFMVHGGLNDYIDEYLYQLEESYFSKNDKNIIFSGHTHVQIKIEYEEKIYCNPGSIGQPRDGNPLAAFAIIKDNKITLKRINYNIDTIAEKMKKAGFNHYYYENLYKGTRIGGKISVIESK